VGDPVASVVEGLGGIPSTIRRPGRDKC
jgi:hypothetical protein